MKNEKKIQKIQNKKNEIIQHKNFEPHLYVK